MSTPEILTIQEPELPPAADHSTPVASSSSTPAPQKGASPVNEPPPPAPAHETGEKAPVEPNPPTVAAEPSLRLEPEGGGQEEADLAARLNRMHSALESLGKWTNLNAEQQRTITDANTFYAQSSEALQQHDLLRAKQLADKADLLIKAILGQPK